MKMDNFQQTRAAENLEIGAIYVRAYLHAMPWLSQRIAARQITLGEIADAEFAKAENRNCGFCSKPIQPASFYQYSKSGGVYCSEECFRLFTED